MIEIKIGIDGIPSPNKVVLGNKWENNDEKIHFDLPQTFDSYNKYVIGVMKQTTGNQTVVLPVKDNILSVSSDLTYLNGNWYLYLMCRQTPLNMDDKDIDLGAKNDEHVFISDTFIGVVNKNMIDKDFVENVPIDTNIQLLYEDLLVLKKDILDQINGNNKITGCYNDLTDKPLINGKELSGNNTMYDFGYLPIHRIDVKSIPALYKAISNIGMTLDTEDASKFLFSLFTNELEEEFENKEIIINTMKINTAEFNPITELAIVDSDDFVLTINKEGVVDYVVNNQTSGSVSNSELNGKLDKYQGVENAGKIMRIDSEGNIVPIDATDLNIVEENNLDAALKEVFTNE